MDGPGSPKAKLSASSVSSRRTLKENNSSSTASTSSSSSSSSSSLSSSLNSELVSSSKEKACNVQVVVRCRPQSDREVRSGESVVLQCNSSSSEVHITAPMSHVSNSSFKSSSSLSSSSSSSSSSFASSSNTRQFTFDAVYNDKVTQEELYDKSVRPLVDEVLAGFNCTVFAYGQTGTGKTHTMSGDVSDSGSLRSTSGVIPRCIHTIFDRVTSLQLEHTIKFSFLELYNEELSDLLAEGGGGGGGTTSALGRNNSANGGNFSVDDDRENSGASDGSQFVKGLDFQGLNASLSNGGQLRLFEDPAGRRGCVVVGCEEILVQNIKEAFIVLEKANQRKRMAETNMNKNSSRSHCVFTITVHTKETNEDGEDIIKTGKLYLVDLAGSECVGRSGAINQRAKEAGKINQSLLTLGRVINALVDRAGYVPYRDSKLTRLLQESLGGRAKTVIIATLSPSSTSYDETLSTLDYANRAKNIKNKPQVNQKMTQRVFVRELNSIIEKLRRENEALRLKNGVYLPPDMYESYMNDIAHKGHAVTELTDQLASVRSKLSAAEKARDEQAQLWATEVQVRKQVQAQLAETQATLLEVRENLTAVTEECNTRGAGLSHNALLLANAHEACQRELYINAAHSARAVKMHEQALSLRTCVEEVINERDALHGKVEAVASKDERNWDRALVLESDVSNVLKTEQESMHALTKDVQDDIIHANELCTSLVSSSSSSCTGLTSSLTADVHSTTSSVSELQNAVKAFVDVSERHRLECAKSEEECRNKVEQLVERNCQQQAEEYKAREEDVKKLCENVLTASNVSTEHVNAMSTSTQEFASQAKDSCGRLSSSLTSSHTSLSSHLIDASAHLSSLLTQHTAATSARNQDLLRTITQMVEEHERQQREELSEAVMQLTNKVTTAREGAQSAHNEQREIVDAVVQSVDAHEQSISEAARTTNSHISSHLIDDTRASTSSLLSALLSHAASSSAHLLSHRALSLAHHDARLARLETTRSQVLGLGAKHGTGVKRVLEETERKGSDRKKEAESWEREVRERSGKLQEKMEKVKGSVNEMHQNFEQRHAPVLNERVNRYVHKEVEREAHAYDTKNSNSNNNNNNACIGTPKRRLVKYERNLLQGHNSKQLADLFDQQQQEQQQDIENRPPNPRFD